MPDLIITHVTGARARNADYYHLDVSRVTAPASA